MSVVSHLTEQGHLVSDLWIDAPDALALLERKLSSGEIGRADADLIEHFIRFGYMIFDLGDVSAAAENIWSSIDLFWQAPPSDLVVAGPTNGGRPLPFYMQTSELKRGPGVRVLDAHSHIPGAYALYMNAVLHRMCGLLMGKPAVATQSLLFEYGSTQSLHRDPWYVNHTPRSHLLAAWIALEDIDEASGPLTYVPGSHVLPYYRFSTSDIVFHDPRVTPTERNAAVAHMNAELTANGLKPKAFLPRKGQVLIWHASLVHGGSPVGDPARTRRSLVVHYGRSDTHLRRGASQAIGGASKIFFTDRKYATADGVTGFHNPLAGCTAADWEALRDSATHPALAGPAGMSVTAPSA